LAAVSHARYVVGGVDEQLRHRLGLLHRRLHAVEPEPVGALLGVVDDVVERGGQRVHQRVQRRAPVPVLGQATEDVVRDPVALAAVDASAGRPRAPALRTLGVPWARWMTDIVLYYYYPERLHRSPRWVRELAEILVACEQFEAYSNRRRGRDYYARRRETLADAFGYLRTLRAQGIVSDRVVTALRALCAEGAFDHLLAQARGAPLSSAERRRLAAGR
jgi:hypothetical protein